MKRRVFLKLIGISSVASAIGENIANASDDLAGAIDHGGVACEMTGHGRINHGRISREAITAETIRVDKITISKITDE